MPISYLFLLLLFFKAYMKSCLQSHCNNEIKEHISNIVTEIVAFLPDEEKAFCIKAVELIVAGRKDPLLGSDYREMSIVLAKHLKGNI